MTETESENRKRLEYEIGAKVRPVENFAWGYSLWPNRFRAVSFWGEISNIYNSRGRKIARLKFKKPE